MQPVCTIPEVRMWLSTWWLNNHTCKKSNQYDDPLSSSRGTKKNEKKKRKKKMKKKQKKKEKKKKKKKKKEKKKQDA